MGGGGSAGRRMSVVACLGGMLSWLDSTVNVAFPAIIDGFDVGVASLQWVVVSYVLTFAALLLPLGRQADRVGSSNAGRSRPWSTCRWTCSGLMGYPAPTRSATWGTSSTRSPWCGQS